MPAHERAVHGNVAKLAAKPFYTLRGQHLTRRAITLDANPATAIPGQHKRFDGQRDMTALEIGNHQVEFIIGCFGDELCGGLEYFDM
jgi:hypothetical protein